MVAFIFHFWVFYYTVVSVEAQNHSPKETQELSNILQTLFRDPNDRFIRPNYLGGAVTVDVEVYISSIGKINVIEKTIRIDLSLTQSWMDYRYKHNMSSSIVPLVGNKHPSNYLWIPDTAIVNAKYAKKGGFRVHVDNMRIKRNGRITLITSCADVSVVNIRTIRKVWERVVDKDQNGKRTIDFKFQTLCVSFTFRTPYALIKLSVYANCDLDFRNYPMDTQTCKFGFESYGYSVRHVRYRFAEGSHIMFSSTIIPQFKLSGYNTSTNRIEYDAGSFDVLIVSLVMKREVELMVMNTFFPSVAVVAVSWISLWIHKKSASARLGTGITTLLTLTWTWTRVNKQVPKVDYVKAIDIYFIVSFVFIFMTMFEYALVAYFNFPLMKMKRAVREAKKTSGGGKLSVVSSVITLSSSCYEGCSGSSIGTINAHKRRSEQKRAQTNECLNHMMESQNTNPKRSDKNQKESSEKTDDEDPLNSEESDCGSDDSSAEVQDVKSAHLYNPKTSTLDIISRVLFPFSYIAFLISFWTFYLRK